ncbi:threonine aldolase family protein [Luteimicrobium subarcticum]|uniref:L-threonine aldolase n=1 Tax=Luteimicrobium subarcticum TaxID=620910 RepID=A0A2M8WJ78_9MICO|nr:beta-eliminating lyase-related protein [Luteimicrobium subarcticum]PJI90948.1 L-threonine aldolase [Luteimicrobium subarcticum]
MTTPSPLPDPTPRTAAAPSPLASRSFASDNYAGAHPEVLAALVAANDGHAVSYGDDPWTDRLQDVVRGHFGPRATAYPVFNGTGANVVALATALPRWGAVVTPSTAHVAVDENGAPERVGGLKLLTVDTPDGRLTPELLDREAWGWGDAHRAQPLGVSVSQSTELGTTYTVDALRELVEHAHRLGMVVHVDGARLSNAAAHLGVGLGELTTDLGVDVVSLGGTKNGLVLGEAVVVLNPDVGDGIEYVRKMTMQLGSKLRFVSAQLVALYGSDLWRTSAAHANAMATRLRAGLAGVEGVVPTRPTESNAVFAALAPDAADRVRERFRFYDWDARRDDGLVEVRWMCAWDTTEADVDAFVDAVAGAV